MADELVPHPAFDFSKYQPGDVWLVSYWEIARRGPDFARKLPEEVKRAAFAVGLGVRMRESRSEGGWRISFFEPGA